MLKKWFGRREADAPETPTEDAPPPAEKRSWFQRLRSGLTKTRSQFSEGVVRLFRGKKAMDAELRDELERLLLMSDFGVDTTERLLDGLAERLSRQALDQEDAILAALKAELLSLITPAEVPLPMDSLPHQPFVVLVIGVNGNGKTTTIGKLAHKYQQAGKRVVLAAGDTYRAAAVEQLTVWGERANVPVISQATGADSAAVVFDAFESAKARDLDVLIADTAGRLHTRDDLMSELEKVSRVLKKLDADAPHEVLLVLDAGTGQNALQQVKAFQAAMKVSGLVLTKLDGTAKGGIIFSIAQETQLPIRYIGIGEGVDDLRPFVAQEFVEALFE